MLQNYMYGGMKSTPIQKIQPQACGNGAGGNGNNKTISLKIKNTTGEKQVVNLFDAAAGDFLKNGAFTSAGVLIDGVSLNYQSLLNRLASNDSYCVGMVRLRTAAGKEAQFDNILSIKRDKGLTKINNIIEQYEPLNFIAPNQEQLNIVDVPVNFHLDRSTSLEFEIEADTEVTMIFWLTGGVQLG